MRHRVLKEGKAVVRPPNGIIDVRIRDLSEDGAKLEINAAMPLPEKFDLINVSDSCLITSELMWRKGNLAGVHFCGPTKKIGIRKF